MERPDVTSPAPLPTVRCFLGLPLPVAVREMLAAACGRWDRPGVAGSWVPVDNYHVTLQFLGDTSPAVLAQLDDLLPEAFGACRAFGLHIQGTGVFPHRNRPRVLYAGLVVDAGSYERLVAVAREGAAALGRPLEDRAHHPHVTLLRLRRTPLRSVIDAVLREGEGLVSDEFQARSVALWESRRLPGGVVYRQLREFPLL